jgi:PKD repeat protein
MAHKVVGDSLKVWNLGYNLPWAGFTYNPLGGFNYLFTSYSPFLNNTWHFGDGSTSNNALTLHTYSASGTYTVSHVVTDFCKTDSVTQVINITATGLNTKVNNNKFVMYPNPANEYLSLKGRDEIESENFKIEIRNTMGQLLYNEKYSEIISIKQLKNGIYFLKVFNSEESYNLQFIKNEN